MGYFGLESLGKVWEFYSEKPVRTLGTFLLAFSRTKNQSDTLFDKYTIDINQTYTHQAHKRPEMTINKLMLFYSGW